MRDNGPTLVYVITKKQFAAVKVGVTSANPRGRGGRGRLDRFCDEAGWKLYWSVRCETRAKARAIETAIKNLWRGNGYLPVFGREMPGGGWTETAHIDALDLIKPFIGGVRVDAPQ